MRPGFTGAGLDRADHLRLDPEKLAVLAARPDARLLRLAGLDPVLDEAGRLEWAPMEGVAEPRIFLGLRGEAPLFAPLVEAVPGQRGWAVFGLLNRMDPADAAIWGGARSVIEWHARHRFCGVCAASTEPFRAGWGRRCTGCRIEHFPRVDPVVIMLAEHGGRILLGRQPGYPAGRYSALAGFVEPGESIEEAVARELMEEAGLNVGDVRYVASQPWPFPGQLMIACTARATTDEIVLDETELEDAFWASREEVAAALAQDPAARFLAPPRFAIAHTLLRHWLSG
ncbi:MAG TPA: NAD(+) diphosphatase [Allosphingosinicella sp.]|nr:NAD(+) diphosphatase [Allosphingosinicella sp.]